MIDLIIFRFCFLAMDRGLMNEGLKWYDRHAVSSKSLTTLPHPVNEKGEPRFHEIDNYSR
jgi:hypothetical protein